MTNASTRRTVIFAGGGTGGHLFPGIAVARELLQSEPDARVLFVGSQKPIEQDIVTGAGFEHVALPSVSPSLAPTRIGSSWLRNWKAYRQARAIIARERPHAVVGLGGFASVPPVLSAWRAGVPIVLLEQNVVPGKATRWLSRFADTVCLPWAETANRFSPRIRVVVTGNPIRREIAALATANDESLMRETPTTAVSNEPSQAVRASTRSSTLLILGGSQGAASLNAAVLDALAALHTELSGWQIVHQTGVADLDTTRQRYAALSLAADVQPFIRDMTEQYRNATCVISRAGATTLAELASAGLPALLVPLPTSAHDHQRLNAQLFVDHSAALMVEPSSPTVDSLRASLIQLLSDQRLRDRLRQNLRGLARPQAASAVVAIVRERTNSGI